MWTLGCITSWTSHRPLAGALAARRLLLTADLPIDDQHANRMINGDDDFLRPAIATMDAGCA